MYGSAPPNPGWGRELENGPVVAVGDWTLRPVIQRDISGEGSSYPLLGRLADGMERGYGIGRLPLREGAGIAELNESTGDCKVSIESKAMLIQ